MEIYKLVGEHILDDTHSVIINYDKYAESPDDWEDDEIFLVYDHKDFTVKRSSFNPEQIYWRSQNNELNSLLQYFIFPVYAYIHSGISLSLVRNLDKWDTTMKGYVLISKTIRENLTEEIAKTYAEGLIDNWNQYLSGTVYQYKCIEKTTCPHCGHIEKEIIDSCGGFYGNDIDELGMVENFQEPFATLWNNKYNNASN